MPKEEPKEFDIFNPANDNNIELTEDNEGDEGDTPIEAADPQTLRLDFDSFASKLRYLVLEYGIQTNETRKIDLKVEMHRIIKEALDGPLIAMHVYIMSFLERYSSAIGEDFLEELKMEYKLK